VAGRPNATGAATVYRLVKERVYSFGVIIGCGLLLLVSILLQNWISDLETIFHWRITTSGNWFRLVVFVASFLVIAFVFSVIYKFIPEVRLNWSDVAVGGLATSLLFAGGKQLISLYIGKTDLGSAYGAAGSLIVFLVWVYYSAQVFLLGAEFTKVYAETFGSRKDTPKQVTSP
jgi:membrane protein